MKKNYVIETCLSYGYNKKSIFASYIAGNLGKELAEVKDFEKRYVKIEKRMLNLQKKNIHAVSVLDSDYPQKMRKLADYPLFLWCKGNRELLKSRLNVGIIGTRKPTEYGKEAIRKIIKAISEEKKIECTIISGLAIGCDTLAHKHALENKIPTIAILPCGTENIAPASNRPLAEEIVRSNGCLLSEYPNESGAEKKRYIERDNVLAELCDIIIVIECGINSGTMHTVRFAEKCGKKIYCVKPPESLGDIETVQGNIMLLKEGRASEISSKLLKD